MTTATMNGKHDKPQSHEPRPSPRNGLPFWSTKDHSGCLILHYVDQTPDGQEMPYALNCGPALLVGCQWLSRDMLFGRRVLELMGMYRDLEAARDGWAAERDQLLERVKVAEGVAGQFRDSASRKARADVSKRQEA
jgi:hypothetical protein